MSDWWWADYVDRRFSLRLEECRLWQRNGTYDDFAVTIIIPMGHDDGHSATWIRITPLPPELGGGLRVLFDGDSVGWRYRETPTLTLGRGLEAPAPGIERHEVTIVAGSDGDIVQPPVAAHNMIEYRSMIRFILRRSTESEKRPSGGPGMARELCGRHGGENLLCTEDGFWSFTLR